MKHRLGGDAKLTLEFNVFNELKELMKEPHRWPGPE